MSLFTSRVARATFSLSLLTGALVAGQGATAVTAPTTPLAVGSTEARPPAPPTTGRDAPFAAAETFALHSKRGAKRTIFIDFDGATVTGTQWNDQGVPTTPLEGFSLDASFATFSAAEHELIQKTWQLVAEDYAPFDIDVTTQQPPAAAIDRAGASDDVYGTTVVVTASRAAHGAEGTCGGSAGCTGVAFLDVFSATQHHSFAQPAWVFTAFHNDLRNIADSVSHEAGHNFGLRHDGKGAQDYYEGHGLWYPIMGSGTNPVGQWSNGAYTGSTEKQDDVAKIATHAPLRADEAGGDVAGAATIRTTGSPTAGIITQRTDVDVYRLPACAGPLTLTATAAPFSPNLDIELRLLGADGATLASNDPAATRVSGDDFTAAGMGASISYAEAAGKTLYARVDGVGNGTVDSGYDDYGSIGQYTLTPACAAGPDTGTVTAPSAPQGLAAQVASGGPEDRVTITWQAPSDDGGAPVTGYRLFIDGELAGQPGAGSTSTEIGDLSPGTHVIELCAVNSAGCGVRARTEVVVPDGGTTLAAPELSKVKLKRNGTVLALAWGEVEHAAGYVVVFLNGRGRPVDAFDAAARLAGTIKVRHVSRKARYVAVYAYTDEVTSELGEPVRL